MDCETRGCAPYEKELEEKVHKWDRVKVRPTSLAPAWGLRNKGPAAAADPGTTPYETANTTDRQKIPILRFHRH